MKLRHLLALVSALALASCVTVTAPDGTVTKSPDAPTVSIGGQIANALIAAFAPKPEPAAEVTPTK